MKLTWTFYPKGQPSVTLTVVYLPKLDKRHLPEGGILNLDTNTAYVNWSTFQTFNKGELKAKQWAFKILMKINNTETIKLIGTDNNETNTN